MGLKLADAQRLPAQFALHVDLLALIAQLLYGWR
jgi:hypothetical protein